VATKDSDKSSGGDEDDDSDVELLNKEVRESGDDTAELCEYEQRVGQDSVCVE